MTEKKPSKYTNIKTVVISKDTHDKLRAYCDPRGLKVQYVAENVIKNWIQTQSA
jgi:hypothetical protein